MKKQANRKPKRRAQEIVDYDRSDTTGMIDRTKPLTLRDLDIELPLESPTQVVSIRLPTALLNQLRAMGSARDIPYQALIKLYLDDAVRKAG